MNLANFLGICFSFVLTAAIASFGWSVNQVLLSDKWQKNAWYFALPTGIVIFSTLSFWFWALGVSFSLISGVFLVILIGSSIWAGRTLMMIVQQAKWLKARTASPLLRDLKKSVEVGLPFRLWGLWWWVALLIFGLVIITGWNWFVAPITWDSLALYDFRALRIAEGWQWFDFVATMRYALDRNYDFLHPMGSSILSAFYYQLGATQPTIAYWGLLMGVLAYSWKVWQRWSARAVWASVWLGTMTGLTLLVEAYGAALSALFWAYILLAAYQSLQEKTDMPLPRIIAFWLLGALGARLVEPYWIVFLLWWTGVFLWRYRERGWQTREARHLGKRHLLNLSIPVLFVMSWQQIYSWAERLHSTENIVSSPGVLQNFLFRIGAFMQPVVLFDVFQVLLRIEVWPYVFLSVIMGVIFWRQWSRDIQRHYLLWGILGVAWCGLLLVGMIVLAAHDFARWQETQQAVIRASWPLVLWGVVWLGAVSEQLEDQYRKQR